MSGFNINAFRANGLKYGGARPSLFTVNLAFPAIGEISSTIPQQLQFVCRATTLPGFTIGAIEAPYFGRKIKLQGDRIVDNWDIVVMNDEDFAIRNAFEAWHNAMNTIVSNRLDSRIASPSPIAGASYKTSGTVTQFSKEGPGDIDGDGAIKSYLFDGVFPLNISPIQVAWDSQNMIEEFQVTLSVDWVEPRIKASDEPIFPVELDPA